MGARIYVPRERTCLQAAFRRQEAPARAAAVTDRSGCRFASRSPPLKYRNAEPKRERRLANVNMFASTRVRFAFSPLPLRLLSS
ncbi:hypothetical protein MHYP_G00338570 [Metynnis hypsauchen]